MNRRGLIISLSIILLGFVVLFIYEGKFETEVSGGEKIKVIVTGRPIERGIVITEEMISTRDVPQAYVEDRAVKDVERAKIVGLRTRNTLQADHTVMWSDLVTGDEDQPPLGPNIQPGSRAITVTVSNEDSSVALIRPGDRVDVIGVLQQGSQLEDPYTAVVLLQRVLVLAAGMQTASDPSKPTPAADPSLSVFVGTLTLSLTIPEAQLLSLASEKGHVTFALRNPEDARTVERIPDVTTEQMVNATQRLLLPLRGNPIGARLQ